MSLNFFNRYPARFDAVSTEYPQGKFRNLSAPNVQDGSYLEQDWLNDHNGFFGALLRKAGLTPNGNVDTALSSQYYDALVAVINSVSPKLVVTQTVGQSTTSVISQKGFTDANNKKWDIQQTVGDGKVMKEGAHGLGKTFLMTSPARAEIRNGVDSIYSGLRFVPKGGEATGASSQITVYNNGVTMGGFEIAFYSRSDTLKYTMAFPSLDIGRASSLRSEFALIGLNVAVDNNGFLKKASPIIHLFSNHIEHNDQFEMLPELEKLGVGIYKITGTLGLAEGLISGDWYIELPKDRYGKPYFNVEYERLEDGVIIRVYERIVLSVPSDYITGYTDREGKPIYAMEQLIVNGPLIDIKEEWRCIDLRFKEK